MIDKDNIMYGKEAEVGCFKRTYIPLVKTIYPKLTSNVPIYYIRSSDLSKFYDCHELKSVNWIKEGF